MEHQKSETVAEGGNQTAKQRYVMKNDEMEQNRSENIKAWLYARDVLENGANNEKNILFYLNKVHHEKDRIRVGPSVISNYSGVPRRDVAGFMEKLESDGYVKVVRDSEYGDMYIETAPGKKLMSSVNALLNLDLLEENGVRIRYNQEDPDDEDIEIFFL